MSVKGEGLRRAKIVATIGPASQSEEVIRQLIQAGMNVARLNFSHGTATVHRQNIKALRRISAEMGRPLMLLQDLQGPKLRVGVLPKNGILLQNNALVRFVKQQTLDDPVTIPFLVDGFYDKDQLGRVLLLDDGRLSVEVVGQDSDSLTARVIQGGLLTSNKGVNLPGSNLGLPSLTAKDLADLAFGISQRLDAIAISFVRNADDILAARREIAALPKPSKYNPLLIAKIEKHEAYANLDDILAVADGVMVARGDLAVETSISKVPVYQKEIIRKANVANKLVITATQMLESMITSPSPTRAEAADVANAVLDGSDAMMLSGETAVGSYPASAVGIMASIISETEAHGGLYRFHEHDAHDAHSELNDDAQSVALAAAELARDMSVKAIFVFTESGNTARLLSKTRTPVSIYAFTPNHHTYLQLALLWGVEAHYQSFSSSMSGMISLVETFLEKRGLLDSTEQVILLSGYPFGKRMPPNFLHLHSIQRKKPA